MYLLFEQRQNPGRLIGTQLSTTGTVPGCSRERYSQAMTKANEHLWEFAIETFSKWRMSTYLRSSDENTSIALELYRWNSELSSAYWEGIAYLEVALRNLLDKKMTQRQQILGRSQHWIFDDFSELGRARTSDTQDKQPFLEIVSAMRRVRKNRKPMTPDQIISELSFGFWHQLVSKKQLFLWPELASGFANAPSRNQNYISALTLEIRDLRNRIGHHHRLTAHSIDTGYLTIISLATAMNIQLAEWIEKDSRIKSLLQNQPMKSHLLP